MDRRLRIALSILSFLLGLGLIAFYVYQSMLLQAWDNMAEAFGTKAYGDNSVWWKLPPILGVGFVAASIWLWRGGRSDADEQRPPSDQ